MKRRVMQLLFSVGLLLTLGAGTLWVRSLWVTDSFDLQREWVEVNNVLAIENLTLECGRKSFMLTWQTRKTRPHAHGTLQPSDRASATWRLSHQTRGTNLLGPSGTRSTKWWERLGFFWWSDRGGMAQAIGIPSRFIVLLPAAVTAPALLWLVRDRRVRIRRSAGLCPTCGYDLRGAEHERCPECGTAVPAAAPRAV